METSKNNCCEKTVKYLTFERKIHPCKYPISKTLFLDNFGSLTLEDNNSCKSVTLGSTQEIIVKNDKEMKCALSQLSDHSDVRIKIKSCPGKLTSLKFPSYVKDTLANISIVGDERPVIGMSYVNGAQTDMGVRFPEALVAPELGDGANVILTFGVNTITVTFTSTSTFFPIFTARNPVFDSLVYGDVIRIWNPTAPSSFTDVIVTSASGNVIKIYGVLPPVILGTTITILPNVELVGSGFNRFITLGNLTFQGIRFTNGDGPFDIIQFQGLLLTLNNSIFDSNLYNTSRKTINTQPNTFYKRLVCNAATHPFYVLLTFVGPKSVFWAESNAYGWVIFSTWVGSDNSNELGDVPRAALIGENGTQFCVAWSSFIKCPTTAINCTCSEFNIQHILINTCGNGAIVQYGSRIYTQPLPNFPNIATACTITNCTGTAITVFYGSHAFVPEIIMIGNANDFNVDGAIGPKNASNNWKPLTAILPAAFYGSTVYHTV